MEHLHFGRLPEGYAANLITAYADEMGLAEPVVPWHVLCRPIIGTAAWCAFLTEALGKIAVDLQSLCRTEVVELGEPVAAGKGVSSAMPQKQNPSLATLIRSAALQVPGLASTLAHCVLAEDVRPAGAWHAERLCDPAGYLGAADHLVQRVLRDRSAG